MTASNCPIGHRELVRRQRRLRVHVGSQVRNLREETGLTQAVLAAGAGINRSHVARIEEGTARPSMEVLVAVAATLGADLGVRLFPGPGPRLRDRLQAPIVEALLRRLHARWMATPELPVPKARGFIDVALALRGAALGLACEVHSELRSVEAVLRRLLEKAGALAELGTHGSSVSTLLVVRSTLATREIVRLHESTFAAAFPARIDEALAALCGPDAPWAGPALLWARVDRGGAALLDRPPRGIRLGR